MDAEDAGDIKELLEHEEDTAGGLMNNWFLTIPQTFTAGEAFEEVRKNAHEIEMVYYVYVLDDAQRLVGVVSLRELLISPSETPIPEIMVDYVKSVTADAEPEEVLEIIAKYNLIAVPVLDDQEKVLGIVTVDDILEPFLPYALKRKRHG